jgi:uncharacterized protein
MPKQILISIIISDLIKSTAFYSALGFTLKLDFSNSGASQMGWGDDVTFMLLSPELASILNTRKKEFVDQKKTVSAVFSFMLESQEAVDQFCINAKENGGTVYVNEDEGDEFMYSFEVEDPDGYILQPTFIDTNKVPNLTIN